MGGPGNELVTGVEELETVISYRDNHTGVARDLNRAHLRASGKGGDRGITNAFRAIQDLCDAISLPKTVSDIGKQLYRRSDECTISELSFARLHGHR